jgi:hypothetical protein
MTAAMNTRLQEPPQTPPASPAGVALWPSRLAAAIACTWFLAHGLRVIFGSESTVMEWLYDDAFYYMIAAKHLSELHMSSFDGVTLTTGYHPLWLWLCAMLYSLRGHLDLAYVRSCMALAFCIASTVLALTLRYAWVRGNGGMLWALALAASSYSALNNGITAMEWPLVLGCWFLLHMVLMRDSPSRSQTSTVGAAFLIGIAGTLSRTDFGLIPASYLAAAILVGLRFRIWHPARRSIAATIGAAAGLPLVFLYNHRMTGTWLQSSAQVKHLAASLASPFNPIPALWQFLRVLLYLPSLDLAPEFKETLLRATFRAALLATLALAAWIAYHRTRRPRSISLKTPASASGQFALLAAIFGIAGYLILDGFNSQATFGWYSGPVTGFIVILAASVLAPLRARTSAIIVVPLMLANIAIATIFGGNAASQMQEVYAGKAMHADHPEAIMGGGDVGKPSFYNNGSMVNLDGLMNNEVVPYLASGRVHCYILQRHIAYLSDIGSVTKPIVDSERAHHGQAPIPWSTYFTAVADSNPQTDAATYLKTNFEAIRASGECPAAKEAAQSTR